MSEGEKKELSEADWIRHIESRMIPPDQLRDKTWSKVIGQKDVQKAFQTISGAKRKQSRVLSDISGKGKSDVIQCLLYGPPGTGKTASSMCIANELDLPFIEFSITDFKKKYVGEGDGNFENAMLAIYKCQTCTKYKGCVLFIDEADDILFGEGNILNTFLTWTNNAGPPASKIRGNLLRNRPHILLATNKIDRIPDNVRDRFNEKIFVSLPKNPTIRGQIFFNALSNEVKEDTTSDEGSVLHDISHLSAANYYEIGIRTKGYSGRQIAILANEVKKASKTIEAGESSFYIEPFFKNKIARYKLTNSNNNDPPDSIDGNITSIVGLNDMLAKKSLGPVVVPISMGLIRRIISESKDVVISPEKMKEYMDKDDDVSKYKII